MNAPARRTIDRSVIARTLPLMIVIGALGALGACAGETNARTAPAPAPDDAPGVTLVAPGLEILTHAPPSGTLDGRDLQPRSMGEIEWRILANSGQAPGAPGEIFLVKARRDSRYGAALAVDHGGEKTLHIDGAESGNPVMPVTDAHADRSISRFDPPLVLGRASIASGETINAQSSMIVESMEKAGRERDRGTAKRTLQFVADETIRTPLGELKCQRVETDFDAKLRFAHATVRTTQWILPGVGAVALQDSETIVILGLVSRTSKQVLVRTTPLPAQSP